MDTEAKGWESKRERKQEKPPVLPSRSPPCMTGPVLLGTLRNMETMRRIVPGKEGRPAGSATDLQPSLCSLQSLTSLRPRTGVGFGGGREGRAERPQGMPPAQAGTARPRPVSQGVRGQGTAHGMYQLWDGPRAGGDGGDPGRGCKEGAQFSSPGYPRWEPGMRSQSLLSAQLLLLPSALTVSLAYGFLMRTF